MVSLSLTSKHTNTMILFLFSIFNMKKPFSIVSPPIFRLASQSLVGFHQPFATTTVMSPVNKKEPINGFPCHLEVSCSYIGTIYNFTLISSFIIWVRGYHQKTHYEAGTYLYLSQSSWLIVLGHDWKHVSCVNNKINEQSAFKITSISDAKYLCSC